MYNTTTTIKHTTLKRDLAFHGDVLNTAARLEKLCRQYHSHFLTTGNVISRLNNVNGVKFKSVGKEKLKGKQQSVEVFSISNNQMNKNVKNYSNKI